MPAYNIRIKNMLKDGYHLCIPGDTNRYHTLRKYFPTVYKVNSFSKTILFLEDKSNMVAKALLEISNKKIMSYQELKQITKVFDAKFENKDKEKFIERG